MSSIKLSYYNNNNHNNNNNINININLLRWKKCEKNLFSSVVYVKRCKVNSDRLQSSDTILHAIKQTEFVLILTTFFLAVDCGRLSVPMNGSSFGNITVFPNSVQFICDPGFILHGSVVRTCQTNGRWSGFQTLCTGMIIVNIWRKCAQSSGEHFNYESNSKFLCAAHSS